MKVFVLPVLTYQREMESWIKVGPNFQPADASKQLVPDSSDAIKLFTLNPDRRVLS